MNQNFLYSSSSLDAIVERNVIELLSAILHRYGRMQCSELLEMFLNMCDEAVNHFKCFSGERILSFAKHSPLLFNVGAEGFVCVTGNGDTYSANMDSVEERLVMFFYVFLRNFQYLHYSLIWESFLRFWCVVKNILSSLSPTQQLAYFQNRSDFRVSKNGSVEVLFMYVSGTENVKLALGKQTVKKVIRFLKKFIKKSGSVHFAVLIDCLCDGLPEVSSFFSGLPLLGKFWFFKSRRKHFYIRRDGYLIPEKRAQAKVVEFFLSVFQDKFKVYYLDLIKMLRNTPHEVSEYFDGFSDAQITKFFTKHKKKIIRDDEMFVHAASNITVSPHPKEGHALWVVNGTRDKVRTRSQMIANKIMDEKSVVQVLLSTLGSEKMHHRKLLSTSLRAVPALLSYFESFSPSDEFWFFKKHADVFDVGNDGYVTAVCPKAIDVSSRDTVKVDLAGAMKAHIPSDIKERFLDNVLINRLVETLNDAEQNQSKVDQLYNTVKGYNEYFSVLLSDLTADDLRSVLRTRPETFLMLDDDTVCLNTVFSYKSVNTCPSTSSAYHKILEYIQTEEANESSTDSDSSMSISDDSERSRKSPAKESLALIMRESTDVAKHANNHSRVRSSNSENKQYEEHSAKLETTFKGTGNVAVNNYDTMVAVLPQSGESSHQGRTLADSPSRSCLETDRTAKVVASHEICELESIKSEKAMAKTDSINVPPGFRGNTCSPATIPNTNLSETLQNIASEFKGIVNNSPVDPCNRSSLQSQIDKFNNCQPTSGFSPPSSTSGYGSEKAHTCSNTEVCKYFVDAVNSAREEVRSAKKVLKSFLDLCSVSVGSHSEDSGACSSEKNADVGKNVLQFYSEMERKSVEFFRRILRNSEVPITVPDLQLFLLAASDDIRSYLNAHYGVTEFDDFFKRHSSFFSVDTLKFVSLK